MGTAGIVVIVLVAVALLALGGVKLARRSPAAAAEPAADPTRSSIPPAVPMTGLESALDQVMDRSGRNMREKLEAEAPIVDSLKVTDDTGPVLRRALDRVEHVGDADGDPPPAH